MLVIRKNKFNELVVTASQNKTLQNPVYLFSFQHIFSKDRISFIPYNVSTTNSRYDEFQFIESPNQNLSQTIPFVSFPQDGQYWYSIYEQLSTGNTDPSKTHNKVEEGRAVVLNDSQVSPFTTYISPNENNSNFIYYTDIENENKVELTFRFWVNIFNSPEYETDEYPSIPFYVNDTLYLTNQTSVYNDPITNDTYRWAYRDINLIITGGSQSVEFYLDELELLNLGYTSADAGWRTGDTLTNITIYPDRDTLVSSEPLLINDVPTGNTCGRYVVFTHNYTTTGGTPSTPVRTPYQEFGGLGCTMTGVSPSINPPYDNQPGLWNGWTTLDGSVDNIEVFNSPYQNLLGMATLYYNP